MDSRTDIPIPDLVAPRAPTPTGILTNPTISMASPSSVQSPFNHYANPYFIHHSDNTSMVFVSDLLTDENYISWSRSMTIALTVKNKIGFIDGLIKRPTGELLNFGLSATMW